MKPVMYRMSRGWYEWKVEDFIDIDDWVSQFEYWRTHPDEAPEEKLK